MAKPKTEPAPVPEQFPTSGGTWFRDPVTGELTPAPAEPVAPQAEETDK